MVMNKLADIIYSVWQN